MTDARIVLIGQVHELIDQIERTTYLFRGDDEGRRQAEGCIAHARKVSAPFNYNGPSIERQELADAQAEIARLRGALSAMELSANTVARCYTHRPENFASALQSLESDASAARELLK